MKKRYLSFTLALLMALSITVPAFAASNNRPNPVVGGFDNGSYGYGYAVTDSKDADVSKMAYNGCLNGLLDSKGRYNPTANITQWEFTRILANMYASNDKFKLDPTWLTADVATQRWVTGVLTQVSTDLGKKITWDNSGTPTATVTRVDACWFVVRMVETSGNYLAPAYWY